MIYHHVNPEQAKQAYVQKQVKKDDGKEFVAIDQEMMDMLFDDFGKLNALYLEILLVLVEMQNRYKVRRD